jgi:toxin ParE1/3/4
MAKIIKISPLAEVDLLDIAIHIATDSVSASDEFLQNMDERFSLLVTQPEMGRQRPELGNVIRSFALRNYVVFYDPIPEGIFIVRVLHGSRDIESIF